MVNEIDIAILVYTIVMIAALLISYLYGYLMIKKTGLFLAQFLIAVSINFVIGLLAILGWFNFSWGINEFLFFGGLVGGVFALIISELLLMSVLFIKRKQLLK